MKKLLPLALLLFFISINRCLSQCTPFIQAVCNTVMPCYGMCNGLLVIDPGWISGTPPYTFTSNYGTITQDAPSPGWTTVSGLCSGVNIIMTITDSAGCTGQDFITLVDPGPVNPTLTTDSACTSSFDGSVTVSNVPTWYWNEEMVITNSSQIPISNPYNSVPFTENNLQPGNYFFKISHEFTENYLVNSCYGCTQYFPFTIGAYSNPPAPNITQSGDTLFSDMASSYQWFYNGTPIPGAIFQYYVATQNGNYTVVITDANNCYNQSSPYPFIQTGMENSERRNSVSIFPNPTTGTLTLSNNFTHLLTSIIINSADGRFIKTIINQNSSIINIDVSDLSAGIYFLDCVGEKGRQMVKVVKY
jgi:hypothetical protein